MSMILEKGHSRVPVYYEQSTNIIGLILVRPFLSGIPLFLYLHHSVPVANILVR